MIEQGRKAKHAQLAQAAASKDHQAGMDRKNGQQKWTIKWIRKMHEKNGSNDEGLSGNDEAVLTRFFEA
ncbi:hypothetical protein ACFS07_31885 [Undibacterium arcticum]